MQITKISYSKTVESMMLGAGIVGCMLNGKRRPEYMAWRSMKHRCLNKDNHAYADYGGREIKICKRWLNSFQNFIKDMGFKPTPKHTLDRINNNQNYTPKNCRWATMKEQCRNRRNNTWLEYGGKRMTKQEWADYLGVAKTSLLSNKKRTFAETVEHYKNKGVRKFIKIIYNGKTKSPNEWAKELTISAHYLRDRIRVKPFPEIYKMFKNHNYAI